MIKSELENLKDMFIKDIIKRDDNVKTIYHYTDAEGLKGICGGRQFFINEGFENDKPIIERSKINLRF